MRTPDGKRYRIRPARLTSGLALVVSAIVVFVALPQVWRSWPYETNWIALLVAIIAAASGVVHLLNLLEVALPPGLDWVYWPRWMSGYRIEEVDDDRRG